MKIHFIGIKGSGMSSLALILHNLNNVVSGSDIKDFVFTETKLLEKNIDVFEFDINNLENKDIIIVTRAYNKNNNLEVKYLDDNKIPYYYYEEYLGILAKNYTSIAISGTHGKTTTTGMLASVLPKILNCGYLIGDGTGNINIDSTHFVFEACEYRRHFLNYLPNISVITNVEFDHPDYFKDENDVINAFEEFISNTKNTTYINGDNLKVEVNQKCKKFGFEEGNDFIISNIEKHLDCTSYELNYNNQTLKFKIPFFGNHMVLNAVVTFLVAKDLFPKLNTTEFQEYLSTFEGQKRRFNIYNLKKQIVIDDYAHHPTEISATFDSVQQKYPNQKKIVVFEPHTYSRTEALKDEFIQALNNFDEVYIMDIFGSPRERISTFKLEELIVGKFKKYDNESLKKIKNYKNTVICFLGAGSISNEVINYLGEEKYES